MCPFQRLIRQHNKRPLKLRSGDGDSPCIQRALIEKLKGLSRHPIVIKDSGSHQQDNRNLSYFCFFRCRQLRRPAHRLEKGEMAPVESARILFGFRPSFPQTPSIVSGSTMLASPVASKSKLSSLVAVGLVAVGSGEER